MQTTICISDSSPEDLKTVVKKLLQEPDPYNALDALYAPDTKSRLIIDGTIKGIPCFVKIPEIDFITASDILVSLGFNAEDLVSRDGNDRSTRFLCKK